MVHNAHNSSFHDPQCTRIRTTLALHYVPFFFPTHTRATTYPLASICSPALHQHARFQVVSTKEKNICFEGNKPQRVCVCVRIHWRERGIHTHWSKEYGEVIFFFFLSFVSERYNQILPYSYDLFFFWWGKHIIFSYSHQTNNALKFFKCFFFYYMHIFFTQTK